MFILDCTETVQMCCDIRPFLKIIRLVISIIQWSVPLLLIVLGTIDMFKAVVKADENATKEAQNTFIKRLLYGVVIFLVPFLVNLILNLVNDNIIKDDSNLTSAEAWVQCWTSSNSDTEMDSYCSQCEDIYAPDKPNEN